MNRKTYLYFILLFLLLTTQHARADDATDKEYQIKAAFLYNFLKFVEWPEDKVGDSNAPIIIAIIGKDVFNGAFDNIKDKTIEGRKVTIKHLKGMLELKQKSTNNKPETSPQIEAIQHSHLLFISPSEKKNIEEILKLVKNHTVLTVADTEGFLDSGGIINLLMEENKVRFEINMIAAKEAKIQIRSQLLRLAKKVIRQETSSTETNQPYTAKQIILDKRIAEKTHGTS
ncbi:MAG: YfiR family protein [Sedimentisphaerales bacterium]|nr:YfiR family protein [Sedimentisphaerales bacterium]